MLLIFKIIYLYLPGAFANMAPVIFRKCNFLNYPISKRLFGGNKTYRGFFFGIILGIIVVGIQKYLSAPMKNINLINYPEMNIFHFGSMIGICALLGDLLKSFIKRRLNIAPGKSFIPFDQIDWIIATNIFLIFYTTLHIDVILLSIVILGILHFLINIISYKLKIRKTLL